MTDDPLAANDEALQQKLAELRQEHADLDAAIVALADKIARIDDQLTPDILA